MSASETLQCQKRDVVGSRAARRLRRAGRIPASLQSDGEHPHVDLSVDADAFLGSRRRHVHLYELDIDGAKESAVVRELQWDALGDSLVHIEFKRVQLGVETESEVELSFYGQVKEGVLNHHVTHITIRSMPSLIPDGIEINVEGLEPGVHIRARDLTLPEGVSLAVDPALEIAVVSAMRGVPEAAPEAPSEEGPAPAGGPEGGESQG